MPHLAVPTTYNTFPNHGTEPLEPLSEVESVQTYYYKNSSFTSFKKKAAVLLPFQTLLIRLSFVKMTLF